MNHSDKRPSENPNSIPGDLDPPIRFVPPPFTNQPVSYSLSR